MGMSINTNISGLNAQRSLASSQNSLQTSMQRLSTGLRINSAKDDASGSAIAERMNAQVKGMNQAMRNANDGISLLQTVDGALGKVTDSMQRMRELAVQAANGTNSASDRDNINTEYTALSDEINRVFESTKFNGFSLLDSNSAPMTFQVGANNDGGAQATDTIIVNLADIQTDTGVASAIDGTVDLSSAGGGVTAAQTAIDTIDAALNKVAEYRSGFGAVQNRFESVVSTLQVASENQASARGRIMDADFAVETANLSRSQVLQQAGTAMLAQANQSSQNVMQLLR